MKVLKTAAVAVLLSLHALNPSAQLASEFTAASEDNDLGGVLLPVMPGIPNRLDISRVPLGTGARQIHQMFGKPETWGTAGSHFLEGVVRLNTSYKTTGRMGPLPEDGHSGYMMLGYPPSDLSWVYRLPDECAFLRFTNWRLERITFARDVFEYDP